MTGEQLDDRQLCAVIPLQCDLIGLPGALSDRLFQSDLFVPVRAQGRQYTIPIRPFTAELFASLDDLIIQAVFPDYTPSPGCTARVTFHGYGPEHPHIMRRLRPEDRPICWQELASFTAKGGFVEIDFLLIGGADKAGSDASDNGMKRELDKRLESFSPPHYGDSLDWATIDQRIKDLTECRLPTTLGFDKEWVIAAHLIGVPKDLAQFQPLGQFAGHQAGISPARVAALLDVLQRTKVLTISVPEEHKDEDWWDVRINRLKIRDILAPGIQARSDTLVKALLEALRTLAPEFAAALAASRENKQVVESQVAIKFNTSESQFLDVKLLLPPGAWRRRLFLRQSTLSPLAYFTMNTTDDHCETALEPHDSHLLRVIGEALLAEPLSFMTILSLAFNEAFNAPVQCRFASEVSHGSAGSRKLVDPGSAGPDIVLGVNLAALFRAHRASSDKLSLCLGIDGQKPVVVVVDLPPIPRSALVGLVHRTGASALRLISLTGADNPRCCNLVIGPLAKNWVERNSGTASRVQQVQFLHYCRTELAKIGVEPQFISRPGQSPSAACTDLRVAACARCRGRRRRHRAVVVPHAHRALSAAAAGLGWLHRPDRREGWSGCQLLRLRVG